MLEATARAGRSVVCRAVTAFGVTAALSLVPTVAQNLDDAQRKLETNRQELTERQRREQGLAGDVSRLNSERERLNQSLVDTARLIQKGEGRLSGIESRLGELEAQERLLRGSLSQRHEAISRLLAAMQRMGRNPPPVIITRREDALQMVRSAMMLATAFPELREQALALAGRLNDLARIMGDIRTEGEKLRAETTRLEESRTRLAQLMESKRQSLAERQAELDKVRREADAIAKSVHDLNELIQRLDKAVADHVGKEPEGRGPRHDALAAAGADKIPASPAGPGRGVEKPPGKGEDAAAPPAHAATVAEPPRISPAATPERAAPGVELAPNGTQVASLDAGRMKLGTAFSKGKGTLRLPAQGRRVLSFGDRTQSSRSQGIVLETRHGAQVTAPAEGWVVFAGEFRAFGQLLIINAGEGYHILLAGLSQIDVQLGQLVLAGEPVGVMTAAPKGAAQGKAPDHAPVLYIEFRKDSRPIDPDPWWVEGSQKVQG